MFDLTILLQYYTLILGFYLKICPFKGGNYKFPENRVLIFVLFAFLRTWVLLRFVYGFSGEVVSTENSLHLRFTPPPTPALPQVPQLQRAFLIYLILPLANKVFQQQSVFKGIILFVRSHLD